MGGAAFDLLKVGRLRAETEKQPEIDLAGLQKILSIRRGSTARPGAMKTLRHARGVNDFQWLAGRRINPAARLPAENFILVPDPMQGARLASIPSDPACDRSLGSYFSSRENPKPAAVE